MSGSFASLTIKQLRYADWSADLQFSASNVQSPPRSYLNKQVPVADLSVLTICSVSKSPCDRIYIAPHDAPSSPPYSRLIDNKLSTFDRFRRLRDDSCLFMVIIAVIIKNSPRYGSRRGIIDVIGRVQCRMIGLLIRTDNL